MPRETVKKPKTTSQTLQMSISVLNVKVREGRIRKKLNKYGSFALLTQDSWNNVNIWL